MKQMRNVQARKPTEDDLKWATKQGAKVGAAVVSAPFMAPVWAGKLILWQARRRRRRFDPNTGQYTTEPMYRYWFRRYIWK